MQETPQFSSRLELLGVEVIRILIAEDEERISRFIEKGLRAAGFVPTVVTDGVTAVDYASSGQFDLLLLDVGLPRLDGFTVLTALRKNGVDLPVIILTARGSAADTVAGLDGGADDYMTKPFRFEELVARIRRRVRPGENNDPPADHIIRYGVLELNLHTRSVSVGDRTVELSAREFALVEMFLLHPGQVLSRQQLLSTFGATTLTGRPTWWTSMYASYGKRSGRTTSSPRAAPDTALPRKGNRDLHDEPAASKRPQPAARRRFSRRRRGPVRVEREVPLGAFPGHCCHAGHDDRRSGNCGLDRVIVQFQDSDARVDQAILDKGNSVVKLVGTNSASSGDSYGSRLHEAAEDIEPRSNEVMAGIVDGRIAWIKEGNPKEPLLDATLQSSVTRLPNRWAAAFGAFDAGRRPLRTVALPVPGTAGENTGTYLLIGRDAADQRDHNLASVQTYSLVAACTLLAAALIGGLVAGRLLDPLRRLREATLVVSHEDLTRRVEVRDGEDDVTLLAKTFNTMLERLDEGARQQQQFLDDAGHELRTPSRFCADTWNWCRSTTPPM